MVCKICKEDKQTVTDSYYEIELCRSCIRKIKANVFGGRK